MIELIEMGLNMVEKGKHEEGFAILKTVGFQVHAKYPNLAKMIEFVQNNVPEEYHNVMNHAWSGVGDWVA